MIDKSEILRQAKANGLEPSIVEKDYVLGWMLLGVQHFTKESWVFKGGTCVKKCFLNEYRFSEDLDFTLIDHNHLSFDRLHTILQNIAEWIYSASGIEISDKGISVELYKNLQGEISAQGKIAYLGPLNQKQKSNLPTIKFDLTAHEQIVLPPVKRPLLHDYSDRPSELLITCYCYEELFAEKIRALAERARPRDLYDVIHLYLENNRVRDKKKLLSSLQGKCSFKKIPLPTFATIEAHPNRFILSSEWNHMLRHQLSDLQPFEHFWGKLPEVFEWLLSNSPPL